MSSASGQRAAHRTAIALLCGTLSGAALPAKAPMPQPAIDLPHPYYYHEMYLPQLTSGPSSVEPLDIEAPF